MQKLLAPREAANILGISYPTLKQWIYRGKLRSVRTPGGHHRIPQSEIDRLTGAASTGVKPRGPGSTASKRPHPAALDTISGRNKLRGTITQVRYEGLLAQVTIDVGGQSVTSIITRSAAEDLRLKKGVEAYALIKATEVMIIRP